MCDFMKQKILYIMHVDWRWIKQRPHFIAEGLSDFYDVTVVHFCSKRYLFQNPFISDTDNNLNILPAFRLPLYQNNSIYNLNKVYMRIYFKLLLKKYNPDIIWITYPQLYDYIPENNCKIIYDCMDLATGFDFEDKSKIMDMEEKLINDSSLVFTSSNYLFNKLIDTYHCEDKLFLIRNAYSGEIIPKTLNFEGSESNETEKTFNIGYVGTISKWIDFTKIKRTLKEINNIEYHFIGPCELDQMLEDSRINFHGPVNYNEIYNHVKDFDCLIVPFNVDDKIEAADPGKIYGYINYNKPIISVYYKELEYFSKFLYFYSTTEDLLDLLNNMVINGFERKYSKDERIDFLKKNSWDMRANEIRKFLVKII
ncbi:MAG: Glycosyltransferase, group 1 family protein [Methanobacterium sp. 42_16]|nr:MAG: Glycosyltransferase, group 1 family protein [Methanobacterium sp. 42_16]